MLRLLDTEFPEATLMTIGSHPHLEAHHQRKLVLERAEGAVRVSEVPCNAHHHAFRDPEV
jgi:putative ATP-binding cassette transporter